MKQGDDLAVEINRRVRNGGFVDGGLLDQLLTARLRRADIFLSTAFHRVTAAHNLKSGAISSLALIIANPGISQNELAEQVRTDKSRIVAIVDVLEREGLADRVQSEVDRRRRALYATPEGVAFLDRLIAEVRELEDMLLSAVPADELARFAETLEKIFASCTRESLGEVRGRNFHSNMPYD